MKAAPMTNATCTPTVIALTLAAVLTASPSASSAQISYRFTTDEQFDASAVRAYAGNHDAIYRHIADHADVHLANLQRWLRQPSVSAQSIGIADDQDRPLAAGALLVHLLPGTGESTS